MIRFMAVMVPLVFLVNGLTKGAPEEVFRRCSRFELEGQPYPMDQILIDDLRLEYEALSEDGFRVLAVAYKDVPRKAAYSKADENEMVLRGYVAFLTQMVKGWLLRHQRI